MNLHLSLRIFVTRSTRLYALLASQEAVVVELSRITGEGRFNLKLPG